MRSNRGWKLTVITAGLVVTLALFGAAFAQGEAVVRVDPAAATIAPGQIVSISIKVDNVSNLAGAEIHLAFNPNVLEVIDADANPPKVTPNRVSFRPRIEIIGKSKINRTRMSRKTMTVLLIRLRVLPLIASAVICLPLLFRRQEY